MSACQSSEDVTNSGLYLVLSGVYTVLTLFPGITLVAEAVVQNVSTQFSNHFTLNNLNNCS